MTGIGGFPAQLILLFICLCSTGLLYPNLTALALSPFAASAGTASALLGTIQYALGAIAGTFVGTFSNGSGLPMILTMTGCAVIGRISIMLAQSPKSLQDSSHSLVETEAVP